MTTLPSSGELPEELVQAAREALGFDAAPLTTVWRNAVASVARALMAERERAARIARAARYLSYLREEHPERIAAAILKEPQP